MDKKSLPIILTPKQMSTRTKVKVALLAVVGGLVYAVANDAAKPSYKSLSTQPAQPSTPATVRPTAPARSTAIDSTAGTTLTARSQAVPPTVAEDRVGNSITIYTDNPITHPQMLIPPQANLLAYENAGAVPKSKMPHSTISTEATTLIEPPEKVIPLLGPVIRESGRTAVVAPPFLLCTVEVMEHGVLVSHQTMGCTQSDQGERPAMLVEFGQEVPNEIPNMKYWLSVQVEGYRQGYPILRTRMELKGLLGRSMGRRKYESVTVVEPNKKHTVIAFNIDDDDFVVTVIAHKQR